jgi:hypothetical protein
MGDDVYGAPSADEINSRPDSVESDPADTRDATHLRRIIAGAEALTTAEAELRAAVATARAAGDTWDMIGVSRQAAYQRFARASDGAPRPVRVGSVRPNTAVAPAKAPEETAKQVPAEKIAIKAAGTKAAEKVSVKKPAVKRVRRSQ